MTPRTTVRSGPPGGRVAASAPLGTPPDEGASEGATILEAEIAAPAGEDPAYLREQLLTYLGNKRALLGPIATAIEQVKRRLGKPKLDMLDAFAGSGVVSRLFKTHAARLISNDLEAYAAAVGQCFLRNRSTVDYTRLHEALEWLNREVEQAHLPRGFIEELYAPRNERRIRAEERVFYTRQNARRLDNYRRLLEGVPADERELLLGPLLSAASIHANTAGVFKGFYKDRQTKIGRFGGSSADALSRIRGRVQLVLPVLSRYECDVEVRQADANALVRRLPEIDLAYFDPPYNQHPYGSNYFMLNLLVHYQRPEQVSRVSGIPIDWQRSAYNVRAQAHEQLRDLLWHTPARYLLISFNDEGFIKPRTMRAMLAELGRVRVVKSRYNAYRGSRNLHNRKIHVTEQLFLVER